MTEIAAFLGKYATLKKILLYISSCFIGYITPVLPVLIWTGIFVVIDTLTGVEASKKKGKKIRSKIMQKKIIPKLKGYITLLLLARGLDYSVLDMFDLHLMKYCAAIICSIEFYSILENLHDITGVRTFKLLTLWTKRKIKEKTNCDIDECK